MHHRQISTALLTVYMTSLILARANPWDYPPTHVATLIQLATVVQFVLLGVTLHMYGGGSAAWPTVIPLLIAQAVGLSIYLGSKMTPAKDRVRPYDTYTTALTTILAVTLSLYAIIPNTGRNLVRHLDILACVMFGLPLAYAIPSIVRPAPEIPTVVQKALDVSILVYTRTAPTEYQEVEFISNETSGARCGLYVQNDTVYVVFSGSNSETDWVNTNYKVTPTPFMPACSDAPFPNGMTVHSGFLDAWRSIEDPVWKKLSEIILRKVGNARIVICGHSLGGAMTTVAAMDLWCRLEKQLRDTLTVVTFGAPVVGNAAFVSSFNTIIPRSTRVVTVYDPVPKLFVTDFVHAKNTLEVSHPVSTPLNAHSRYEYDVALKYESSKTANPLSRILSIGLPYFVLGGGLYVINSAFT